MDHLVGQLERVRWKMPHSRQFASEERWGPMAVFPAPRPTGEPPGPGRGSMQLADAVGWLCLMGCWRNGAEGGADEPIDGVIMTVVVFCKCPAMGAH